MKMLKRNIFLIAKLFSRLGHSSGIELLSTSLGHHQHCTETLHRNIRCQEKGKELLKCSESPKDK